MNIKVIKNHRKKFIFCIIILGVIIVAGVATYYSDYFQYPILVTNDDSRPYEYMIYRNYIEITRYTGAEKVVKIPDTICNLPVKKISFQESTEKGAFRGKSMIKEIYIPDSVSELGTFCFADCVNLEKVRLSPNIHVFGINTFQNCVSLQSVEIPEGITTIGLGAFRDCYNLEKVEFPQTLKNIPAYSFQNCEKLTKVEIPAGVERIGGSAFQNCEKLTEIEIPAGVKEIDGEAFKNTGWEKNWGDGFFIAGNNVLLHYSGTEEIVEVPEGVEYIGESVITGCKNMRILILPESMRECEWGIVNDCGNLKYIVVKNSGMEFPNWNSIYSGDGEICIVGEKGSTAEKHAKENGHNFLESIPEGSD